MKTARVIELEMETLTRELEEARQRESITNPATHPPLKVLSRDFINATIETLIEEPIPSPEYVAGSVTDHIIADDIVSALGTHYDHMKYRAVIQGLFESGFINTNDSDFGFEKLLEGVVGVKMYHALPSFNKLFDLLVKGGFTDHDTNYNPSGDNYYSAYSFNVEPDDTDILDDTVRAKLKDRGAPRNVIVVENQGPMFAYILDHSIYTGEPKTLTIVRMKEEYDDPDKLPELLEMEFDFGKYNYEWSANRNSAARIMAVLDIPAMECKDGWFDPVRVCNALFNIYSGVYGLEQDSK